jgi:hypothetical protein
MIFYWVSSSFKLYVPSCIIKKRVMLTGTPGYWLSKPKKESFKLKYTLYCLLRDWQHNFQRSTYYICFLTGAPGKVHSCLKKFKTPHYSSCMMYKPPFKLKYRTLTFYKLMPLSMSFNSNWSKKTLTYTLTHKTQYASYILQEWFHPFQNQLFQHQVKGPSTFHVQLERKDIDKCSKVIYFMC